jgi:hypothetical protein
MKDTCNWNQEFEDDFWSSDCGGSFTLNEGPPSENGMKFCCYCGKPLTESPFQYDEVEDEDV